MFLEILVLSLIEEYAKTGGGDAFATIASTMGIRTVHF